MSTKTTFKRIALVAVAALGLGVLSVAPSQAKPLSITLTPSATTSTIKTGETATITLTASGILTGADDLITIAGVRTLGTSGVVHLSSTTDSVTTVISGTQFSNTLFLESTTATNSAAVVRAKLTADFTAPSTKGTYNVTFYTTNVGSGTDVAPFVWTITVTADSTSADAATTSYIAAAPVTGSNPTADSVVTASKSATGAVASILVTQKNSTLSANEPLNVYVSGPGYISAGTDTLTASSTLRSLTTTGASQKWINVFADGTTGVSTITIVGSVTGTILATESLTFSDTKPASIAVTVKKAYIAAGVNTAKVFAVTLKDASGNAITGLAASIAGARTDTTTAGKALATAASACAWNSTDLVYYCDATGASTVVFGPASYTFTVTGTDADATTVASGAVSTIYADTVATSVTISAPATANVGDKITYTLTAKEKNGYPVADASYEVAGGLGIFWNTTTVPAYTGSVTPFNSGETITTVSGVATKSLYVPAIAGTISATWTLAGKSTAATGAIAASIAGTTVTATTVVTNPGVDAATDAANEATDAANAATDAALAAADAADAATAAAMDASDAVAALSATVAKLVASLKAQITSLTNLVIKIQKKVKA